MQGQRNNLEDWIVIDTKIDINHVSYYMNFSVLPTLKSKCPVPQTLKSECP